MWGCTHTHCVEHEDAVTTVNTVGHLGLISGLYGLRAITATSYWLWQIVCQSLGNPSKLVIYLFGTLLALSPTVSPCCLSSLFLALSSSHPPSLLQFSLVSHLLLRLPLSFCSQSVSLSLWTPVLFSLSSPFFLPGLPLTLKHYLCLSFFFPPLSPPFVPFALFFFPIFLSSLLYISVFPLFSPSHVFLSSFLFVQTFFVPPLSSSIFRSLYLVYLSHSSFLISVFSLPFHLSFYLTSFLASLLSLLLFLPFFLVLHLSLFPPPISSCFILVFPPPVSLFYLLQIAFSLTFPSLSLSSTFFIFFLSACRAAQLMAIFPSFTRSLLSLIYPSICPLYSFSSVYQATSYFPATPHLALSLSLIPSFLSLYLLPPSSFHPPPPAERNSSEEGCWMVEGL